MRNEIQVKSEIAKRETLSFRAREQDLKRSCFHIGHVVFLTIACIVLLLSSCSSLGWDSEVAVYEVYNLRAEDSSVDIEEALRERGVPGKDIETAKRKVLEIKHVGE